MHATWKTLAAAAVLAFAGLAGPARAEFGPLSPTAYTLENRPHVVFPGQRVHVSPYPASKRAASVWTGDRCWRTCTGQSGWRFQDCARVSGIEACRDALNADNRLCLRSCRTLGGPMLPFD